MNRCSNQDCHLLPNAFFLLLVNRYSHNLKCPALFVALFLASRTTFHFHSCAIPSAWCVTGQFGFAHCCWIFHYTPPFSESRWYFKCFIKITQVLGCDQSPPICGFVDIPNLPSKRNFNFNLNLWLQDFKILHQILYRHNILKT